MAAATPAFRPSLSDQLAGHEYQPKYSSSNSKKRSAPLLAFDHIEVTHGRPCKVVKVTHVDKGIHHFDEQWMKSELDAHSRDHDNKIAELEEEVRKAKESSKAQDEEKTLRCANGEAQVRDLQAKLSESEEARKEFGAQAKVEFEELQTQVEEAKGVQSNATTVVQNVNAQLSEEKRAKEEAQGLVQNVEQQWSKRELELKRAEDEARTRAEIVQVRIGEIEVLRNREAEEAERKRADDRSVYETKVSQLEQALKSKEAEMEQAKVVDLEQREAAEQKYAGVVSSSARYKQKVNRLHETLTNTRASHSRHLKKIKQQHEANRRTIIDAKDAEIAQEKRNSANQISRNLSIFNRDLEAAKTESDHDIDLLKEKLRKMVDLNRKLKERLRGVRLERDGAKLQREEIGGKYDKLDDEHEILLDTQMKMIGVAEENTFAQQTHEEDLREVEEREERLEGDLDKERQKKSRLEAQMQRCGVPGMSPDGNVLQSIETAETVDVKDVDLDFDKARQAVVVGSQVDETECFSHGLLFQMAAMVDVMPANLAYLELGIQYWNTANDGEEFIEELAYIADRGDKFDHVKVVLTRSDFRQLKVMFGFGTVDIWVDGGYYVPLFIISQLPECLLEASAPFLSDVELATMEKRLFKRGQRPSFIVPEKAQYPEFWTLAVKTLRERIGFSIAAKHFVDGAKLDGDAKTFGKCTPHSFWPHTHFTQRSVRETCWYDSMETYNNTAKRRAQENAKKLHLTSNGAVTKAKKEIVTDLNGLSLSEEKAEEMMRTEQAQPHDFESKMKALRPLADADPTQLLGVKSLRSHKKGPRPLAAKGPNKLLQKKNINAYKKPSRAADDIFDEMAPEKVEGDETMVGQAEDDQTTNDEATNGVAAEGDAMIGALEEMSQ